MSPTNYARGAASGGPERDEPVGIDFHCRRCDAVFDRYHERCPQCGDPLGDEFSATYRSPPSPVAKAIAFVVLIGGFVVMLLLLLCYLAS